MPNPSRLDLVEKAIRAGVGYIEWQDAALKRFKDDPEMAEFTPRSLRERIRQFVIDGGVIDVRPETRPEWIEKDPDNPYWYRVVLPASEPSDEEEIFVEILLTHHDEEVPCVEIVNVHPQRR